MWWWALVAGCDKLGPPPQCGPEECAPVCAGEAPPAPTEPTPGGAPEPPTEFEQKILDAELAEIRRGIQPWSDTAIGVCKGRKDCDKFLGVSPGKLARGAHFVKAELRVPPGPPGAWKVKFQTDCKTPAGETKSFEREYDVSYTGPEAPFKLWPLRPIDSPSEDGAEVCTWTLTTHDPRGDKTYTGSWEVTGK